MGDRSAASSTAASGEKSSNKSKVPERCRTSVGAHTQRTLLDHPNGGTCAFKCGARKSLAWLDPRTNTNLATQAEGFRLAADAMVCMDCYRKASEGPEACDKSVRSVTTLPSLASSFGMYLS